MAVGLVDTMETLRIQERNTLSSYAAVTSSLHHHHPHHQQPRPTPMYRPPPPLKRSKTPNVESSSGAFYSAHNMPPPPPRPKSSAANVNGGRVGSRESARHYHHHHLPHHHHHQSHSHSSSRPSATGRTNGHYVRREEFVEVRGIPVEPSVAGPWSHMAQTYTWVDEQEYVKHNKKGQWVPVLQPTFHVGSDRSARNSSSGKKGTATGAGAAPGGPVPVGAGDVNLNAHDPFTSGRTWEELAYAYEADAERWMRLQEEARRKALEKEKQKSLFEQARRAESIKRKKEFEQRKMAEERARMNNAALYERERRERAARMMMADKSMANAWEAYESRWTQLTQATTSDSPQQSLKFDDIPWPVLLAPSSPQKITPAAIVNFLFSPHHSKGLSNKDRIRSAQLRWHPDRFRRISGRVHEDHREAVEAGVGIVARCLNDLMSRETAVNGVAAQRKW